MKDHDENSLAAFEKYLFEVVESSSRRTPLSTDEICQILQSYNPPEGNNLLHDERIVSVMKDVHQRKKNIERKLKNVSLIHSFGELLKMFIETKNIHIHKFVRVMALSLEEFRQHLEDRRTPEALGKQRVLNIAALLDMSIEDMVVVLDRTVRFLQIKGETNLAAGHARADKCLRESSRQNVMSDAMKELLLVMSEHESEEPTSWKEFKRSLFEEAGKEGTPFSSSATCFTLRRQGQSVDLLQQLQKI